MDCSPPGSSVYGMFQARRLECIAIFRLQGIFPVQGSNPRLLHPLHRRVGSLTTEPQGSPWLCTLSPNWKRSCHSSFCSRSQLTPLTAHLPIKGSPHLLLPLSSRPGSEPPAPPLPACGSFGLSPASRPRLSSCHSETSICTAASQGLMTKTRCFRGASSDLDPCAAPATRRQALPFQHASRAAHPGVPHFASSAP